MSAVSTTIYVVREQIDGAWHPLFQTYRKADAMDWFRVASNAGRTVDVWRERQSSERVAFHESPSTSQGRTGLNKSGTGG